MTEGCRTWGMHHRASTLLHDREQRAYLALGRISQSRPRSGDRTCRQPVVNDANNRCMDLRPVACSQSTCTRRGASFPQATETSLLRFVEASAPKATTAGAQSSAASDLCALPADCTHRKHPREMDRELVSNGSGRSEKVDRGCNSPSHPAPFQERTAGGLGAQEGRHYDGGNRPTPAQHETGLPHCNRKKKRARWHGWGHCKLDLSDFTSFGKGVHILLAKVGFWAHSSHSSLTRALGHWGALGHCWGRKDQRDWPRGRSQTYSDSAAPEPADPVPSGKYLYNGVVFFSLCRIQSRSSSMIPKWRDLGRKNSISNYSPIR